MKYLILLMLLATISYADKCNDIVTSEINACKQSCDVRYKNFTTCSQYERDSRSIKNEYNGWKYLSDTSVHKNRMYISRLTDSLHRSNMIKAIYVDSLSKLRHIMNVTQLHVKTKCNRDRINSNFANTNALSVNECVEVQFHRQLNDDSVYLKLKQYVTMYEMSSQLESYYQANLMFANNLPPNYYQVLDSLRVLANDSENKLCQYSYANYECKENCNLVNKKNINECNSNTHLSYMVFPVGMFCVVLLIFGL